MANPKKIVTPVALTESSSATACLPWFVDLTEDGPAEFPPVEASYKPLVNGEEAFGELYDAIFKAKHSIDYICWGFQPSMYFKRDGSSPCIGDLLIEKGLQGVKIRILCWADSALVAQTSENPVPGLNLSRGTTQNENNTQIEYDRAWYYRARIAPSPLASELSKSLLKKQSSIQDGRTVPNLAVQPLRNIEFVTRDFSLSDRWEIMHRESRFRADKNVSQAGVGLGYGLEPSHHQKMVLIDYEAPEHAVGFVMGHNTLDAYWDTDAHRYARMNARLGRNGATPRQDMSGVVTGPILEHLNVNFCRAWKRSTKVDLLHDRNACAARLKLLPGLGTPVMAQINRTQSQESIRNIKEMYLQAVNNATQCIYIENQYFRWSPLADKVKEVARRYVQHGRDSVKHGQLYLFVVTNSTDEAVGMGTGTTYDMLDNLGRADTMPEVARISRAEQINRDTRRLRQELQSAMSDATSNGDKRRNEALKELEDLKRRGAENTDKNKPILPKEIPGLRIHVCTLVAPDSPGNNWMPVYVHSKIMTIDDVFLTHGSANINERSMAVDSELNICHENQAVTKPLRQRLWKIHTAGQGAQDDPASAYTTWDKIVKKNQDLQGKHQSPAASLVGFIRTSPSRVRLD